MADSAFTDKPLSHNKYKKSRSVTRSFKYSAALSEAESYASSEYLHDKKVHLTNAHHITIIVIGAIGFFANIYSVWSDQWRKTKDDIVEGLFFPYKEKTHNEDIINLIVRILICICIAIRIYAASAVWHSMPFTWDYLRKKNQSKLTLLQHATMAEIIALNLHVLALTLYFFLMIVNEYIGIGLGNSDEKGIAEPLTAFYVSLGSMTLNFIVYFYMRYVSRDDPFQEDMFYVL